MRDGRRRGRGRATRAASTPAGADAAPLRVAPEELDEALERARRSSSSPGCRWRSRTSRAVAEAGVGEDVDGRAAAGPARARCARCPVASRRGLRARRPRALPEHGRDGRRHRARRRRDRRRGLRAARAGRARSTRRSSAPAGCAASSASTAWAARRRSPRSPTAPRRSRAVDVIVGPGNLYVQEAKRQLSGTRRHRRLRRARATCSWSLGRRRATARRWSALDLLAQAEHGEGSLVVGASRRRASVCDALGGDARARCVVERPTVGDAALRARRRSPTPREAIELANAFAPEHLQLIGADAEALAPRVRTRRLRVRRRRERAPRSATTSPAPTTSCRPAAPRASPRRSRPRHFRRRMAEVRDRPGGARRSWRRAGAPIARAEGFEVHARVDGGAHAGRIRRHEPHGEHRAQDRRDRRRAARWRSTAPARATRATGVGFLDHMLDLLARHGRLDLDVDGQRRPARPAPTTRSRTSAIVLGQALDEALGDRAGIVRYGSATVPMDEARASCAIDISGRPFTRVRGRPAAGLDRRLRARADRGVLPRRSPTRRS